MPSTAKLIVGATLFALLIAMATSVGQGVARLTDPPRDDVEVPATLLSAEGVRTKEHRYRLELRFEFDHGGRTHVGERLQPEDKIFNTWAEVQRRLDRLEAGAPLTAYLPRGHAANAFLELPPTYPWAGQAATIGVLLVGAVLIGLLLKPRRPKGTSLTTERKVEQPGAGCSLLFGLPFFGIFFTVGMIAFVSLFYDAWSAYRSSLAWVETPCTIEETWISQRRGEDGPTYRAVAFYRYSYGGRERRADAIYPGNDATHTGSKKGQRQLVSRFEPGTQTVCYVDPNDPARACLLREFPSWRYLTLFTLLFVLIGASGLLWMCVTVVKELRASYSPHFTPKLTPEQRAPSKASWLPAHHASDGPRVLEPAYGRLSSMGCLLSATVIWNGIVLLIWMLSDAPGSDWGLIVILMLFGAAGLAMLAASAYYLMALFNPAPVIALSDGVIEPGQSVNLSWSLRGSPGRLDRLDFELIGTEHATYTRGTDTVTDTEPFFRMQLRSVVDPLEMTGGELDFQLPADAAHTFKSEHNELRWELHVKGPVPFWPDIDDSYELIVLPRGGAPEGAR